MRSQIMMARSSAGATSDSGGSTSPNHNATTTATDCAATTPANLSVVLPVTPGTTPSSLAFVRPWELDVHSVTNRGALQHQQSQQLVATANGVTDTNPPLSAPPITTLPSTGAPPRSPPLSAFLYPPPQVSNGTTASQILLQLRAMAAASQQQQAATLPMVPAVTAPPVTPAFGNVDLQTLINAQQLQQQLMLLSQIQSAVIAANTMQNLPVITTCGSNVGQQQPRSSPKVENDAHHDTYHIPSQKFLTQSDSGMSDTSPRSEQTAAFTANSHHQLKLGQQQPTGQVMSPACMRNVSGPYINDHDATPRLNHAAVAAAREPPGSSSASSSTSPSTHGNNTWDEEILRSPGSSATNTGRRRTGKKDRNRPPPLVFADPRISNVQQCSSPSQHPPVLSPNTSNLHRHQQSTPHTAPPIGIRRRGAGNELQSAFTTPIAPANLQGSSSCSLLNDLHPVSCNNSALLCTPATTTSSLSSFSTGSSVGGSLRSLAEQQMQAAHEQNSQSTWRAVWLCFGADVNIRLAPAPGILHGTNFADCLPWHSASSMRSLVPEPETVYPCGLRLIKSMFENCRHQLHFADASGAENSTMKPIIIAEFNSPHPFWCTSRRAWCAAGGDGNQRLFDALLLTGKNESAMHTHSITWQSLELGDIVAGKLDAELSMEAKRAPEKFSTAVSNENAVTSMPNVSFAQPLPPATKFQPLPPHSTGNAPNEFVHNLAMQFAAAAAASQHQQQCNGGAPPPFGHHRTPVTPSALFSPSLQLMPRASGMLASPTTPQFLSPTQPTMASFPTGGNCPQLVLTSDDQQQQHQASVAVALTEWFNRARLTSPTVPGQPPLSPFLLAAAAAAHQHQQQQMSPMFASGVGMCTAPPLGSPAAFSAGLGFGFMGGGPMLTPVSRNSHHSSTYKREPVSKKFSNGGGNDSGESSSSASSSSHQHHHPRQRGNINGSDGSESSARQRDLNRSRRPMNAFMLFAKQHRTFYTKRYPGRDNRTISCMLGEHWKSLDSTQRREFAERAKVMAEDYKKVHPDCYKRNGVPGNKKRT